MNIFKTASYLEKLIKYFDMRNYYNDLERRAPKLFDFIKRIGAEEVSWQDEFKPENWTVNQMIKMGVDFYQGINPVYLQRIKNFMNKPYTFLLTKYAEKDVEGVVDRVGEATLVRLGLTTDLRGPLVVVHEFGHILNEKFQQGKDVMVAPCLSEISSIFFEKLYIRTQLQKGLITDEEYEGVLLNRQSEIKLEIGHFLREREIVKSLGEPVTLRSVLATQLKLGAKGKVYRKQLKLIKTSDYTLGQKSLAYIIGELTSAALIEDFTKNPDGVMKRMEIFMDNSSSLTENQAFTLLLGDNYEDKLGFSFKEKSERQDVRTK